MFAIHHEENGDHVLIFHNLSDAQKSVKLGDLPDMAFAYEVFADDDYGQVDLRANELQVNRYGYRWMRGRSSREFSDDEARSVMRQSSEREQG